MIMAMTNAQLAAKVQELEDWKEKMVTDLRREADERGWCDEFNDFMKDHGVTLPAVPYNVEIVATVDFSLTLDAEGDEDAEERAGETGNEQALRDAAIAQIRAHGFDTFEVTEANKV